MMCHGRRRLAANDYDSVLGRKAGCAVRGVLCLAVCPPCALHIQAVLWTLLVFLLVC